MFSPVFLKALVLAGLVSQILAVVVCMIFGEYELIPRESLSLSIWVGLFVFHKKTGTF